MRQLGMIHMDRPTTKRFTSAELLAAIAMITVLTALLYTRRCAMTQQRSFRGDALSRHKWTARQLTASDNYHGHLENDLV